MQQEARVPKCRPFVFEDTAGATSPQPALKTLPTPAAGRARGRGNPRSCEHEKAGRGSSSLWSEGTQGRRDQVPTPHGAGRPGKASGQQPDATNLATPREGELGWPGIGRMRVTALIWGQQRPLSPGSTGPPPGQFPGGTSRGPPTSSFHRTWDVAGAGASLPLLTAALQPTAGGLWAPLVFCPSPRPAPAKGCSRGRTALCGRAAVGEAPVAAPGNRHPAPWSPSSFGGQRCTHRPDPRRCLRLLGVVRMWL